ncbi:MAG: aminopeptidase P family protein [Eggerthellaceae bacterium]|nr:aminopeptidase P family protein [Eggerthellaceae bacterium]
MNRISKLQARLQDASLDALYVRDTANIAYLTQFEGVFDDEQAHALLVSDTTAVLHTDSRYAAAARHAAAKWSEEHGEECPVRVDDEASTHATWLATQLSHSAPGIACLGIEDSISLAEYRKLEGELEQSVLRLQETSGFVQVLRALKDEAEIARLRAAQAITDAAFAYILTFMKPGMTEQEVQRELDNYMFLHGASGLAFPTIVATGPNGANPHAQPTDTVLEAGQCVVMDFGAKAAGYCADMTRTVFLGQPEGQLLHAFEALREANEAAQAFLRPGLTGAQVHQRALDVLEAAGYGDKMGHGLGHGVGMEVHEEPLLSPRNTAELEAGNVVTVEPGIYIEGQFGMRLEDYGLITENGFDVLTQSSHDLFII